MTVPVPTAWVARDLPTGPGPVAAFEALGAGAGSVLWEQPGEGTALVGLDPVAVALARGGRLTWTGKAVCAGATLVEVLRGLPGVPAVCVLGGDALRDPARGSRGDLPDSALVFPSLLISFQPDRVRLLATDPTRLDALAAQLAAVPSLTPGEPVARLDPAAGPEGEVDSEILDGAYRDLIVAAHRRIVAGEARQVTISRRFVAATAADPLAAYQALRATNPSPYHFLLRLPGVTLTGASPQGLIRVVGRQVSIPVIAGTRRRGADPAADAALAAELLADPKERDEHAMLVELARADLARVAEPGSVRVGDGFPQVRRFARVMHLVSEVRGELAPGRTRLDALAAVFPAGTVTGTPREAALRIIDEIEPHPRGLYGGGVGWLGPGGELDVCLGIRTLQFHAGTAACQAGAGVVAGSVPDREVRESRDKVSALFAALAAAARP